MLLFVLDRHLLLYKASCLHEIKKQDFFPKRVSQSLLSSSSHLLKSSKILSNFEQLHKSTKTFSNCSTVHKIPKCSIEKNATVVNPSLQA